MAFVIQTKILPPTDVKGTRVKAVSHQKHGSVTQPYNHAWDADENHQVVAELLAMKFGWSYTRIESGQLPNDSYAHIIF